jgi:hypothetical protein
MGETTRALEHSEHISHAAGHHETGHGDRLSTRIGITIAVLGVFLAVAGAKVGGERTEMVGTMVKQEHAHAEFQMQNIKHRLSVLILRQIHASMPRGDLSKSFQAELKKVEAERAKTPESAAAISSIQALGNTMLQRLIPQKEDALMFARLVDRYYYEQAAAEQWVRAYDSSVEAHSHAQELYEYGQLAAEFGVVVCSLALLFHSRLAWMASILLGLASITIVMATFFHTWREVAEAEHKIEANKEEYEVLHKAGKTRPMDDAMIDQIMAFYGEKREKPPTASEHKVEHDTDKGNLHQ